MATWEPMIGRIGTDVTDGKVTWGADPIERSAVRRYLEPLELDCALHYDVDVAREHGYPEVTAPYSSFITFAIPPMWEPGQRVLTSDDRDAQPALSPIDGEALRVAPEVTGFFATDMEIDFLRPPVVGDRLGRRGGVLKACVPKWTTVGRGAFMTLEAEVITETGEVVARVRNTVFAYEPVGPPSAVVGAERDAS
jgi:acyl dehydratase